MNIKYDELAILLTWIKGQEIAENITNEEMSFEDILNATSKTSFKWDKYFNLSVLMVKAGLGENDAVLEGDDFEDIFEKSVDIYKKMNFEEIEKRLKEFEDFDMVQDISDKLGYDVHITEDSIKEELNKLYKYRDIIENGLLNYIFTKSNLKEKQLEKLETKLKNYILNEEFEKCSELQIKINDIKKGTI